MKESTHGAASSLCSPSPGVHVPTGFNRLLRWRFYPGLFHVILYASLAVLVYFAFNPARRAEGNLATEMVWKLWWPGLPFILLLGGRIWCGVCPFGGVADAAGKLRKQQQHTPPLPIRRSGPWLGLISVFGFGMAFLALGLEDNAGATGIILIGMALLAFGQSFLYRGRAFCRYFCPVGMIARVYSFLSWLKPRGGGVRLETAACPVGQSPGSLRQPSQCHLCGACTRTREPGGILTTFGLGSVRAPQRLEFGRAEAALSLLLLGLMAADSVRMTILFARYQQFALPYFGYNYRLSVVAGVGVLVSLVMAVPLFGSWLGSRRRKNVRAFEAIAFSYVPLSLGIFLSLGLQHLWSGLWPSLQTALAESRIIDWSGHMPPANVYFTSIPLKSIQFLLMGAGFFMSWRLARKGLEENTMNGSTEGGAAARRFMLLPAAAGFGALFLLPMSGAC